MMIRIAAGEPEFFFLNFSSNRDIDRQGQEVTGSGGKLHSGHRMWSL